MKISNKMLVLSSIGILIILFIRGIYNSINTFDDAEYGFGYILGQAVGGTLAWFSIIAFVASLIFLVIGIVKKIKKTESRKIFITSAVSFATSVAAIAILTGISFAVGNIESEHQKAAEQRKKDNEYLMAAANFYNDIDSFEMFSTLVLSGYSTTWSEAITNHKDFNVELILKKTESDPMIKHADLLYTEMGQQLKIVSEATKEHPKQYKEVYEEYKKIYSVITALNEQMNSPTGSLISFNQNVNSLIQEYKKAQGSIKIAITDEIKNKSKQIEESRTKK
ncbi:hypothetical protein ACQVPJ_22310 [Bacillus mycoides]|uniref:Uncharacterized protein n=1 Tax=Bacillus cereus VD021 TaxID=1053224 RepID=R8HG37_BACCE|nr:MULTISPECIES: hypothetical protein [Bacillus cereus group]EOO71751.1 hypothetical protein IIC_04267 [Bacillus cereus VD021]MCQ6569145.1 hypothetical protein [Bacillus mycoides]